MNKENVFLVVGGDLRQVYTAKKLAENNKVYAAGFDNNIIGDSQSRTYVVIK